MAGTLVIDALTDGSGNTTAATNAIKGSAKAWVVYDGANLVIKGSYNVSSVTRVATGQFNYSMTNAMPDTNYAVVASGINADDGGGGNFYPGFSNNFTSHFGWSYTTSQFRGLCLWSNNTYHNPYWVSFAVFR